MQAAIDRAHSAALSHHLARRHTHLQDVLDAIKGMEWLEEDDICSILAAMSARYGEKHHCPRIRELVQGPLDEAHDAIQAEFEREDA